MTSAKSTSGSSTKTTGTTKTAAASRPSETAAASRPSEAAAASRPSEAAAASGPSKAATRPSEAAASSRPSEASVHIRSMLEIRFRRKSLRMVLQKGNTNSDTRTQKALEQLPLPLVVVRNTG
eukprot:Blabericola_migrator_1__572@NODE_1141_length_5302_cov_97_735435_g583_i1_p3_GENE_NODE_1141_length_5302_cov_97_735435_g583_i1NODE_1141_length_5302_cov_97_735435_g583_i1_p3_ORF_typecomplete_len123_score8_19FAP/PF07174_11/0_053_NODE_1141_length_5302_cov_97_735435_g583_i129093277